MCPHVPRADAGPVPSSISHAAAHGRTTSGAARAFQSLLPERGGGARAGGSWPRLTFAGALGVRGAVLRVEGCPEVPLRGPP